MILFLFLAGALSLIAAFILARPLLRAMEAPATPAEHGQAVYRDQLAEVERDAARGLLSADEAAAARAEIGRRILASERKAETRAPTGAARPAVRVAILTILVPLAAAAVYALLGRPGVADQPLSARLEAGETRTAGMSPQLEGAIAELSERLRRNPDNYEDQLMLSRALFRVGRYEDSVARYQEALALAGNEPAAAVLSEYGQARVMANDGAVDQEAVEAFRAALDADPANPEARFWMGAAMVQFGRPDVAYQVWSALLRDSPPDAPWVPVVREQLAALEQMGMDGPADAPDEADEPEADIVIEPRD